MSIVSYGLPAHGKIECSLCHRGQAYSFDTTRTEVGGWRITNNPMAWGGSEPEIIVLGFSKGPTQAGALSRLPHEQIAFKGGRSNLAKILHHVGLLPRADSRLVDQAISDPHGRIHFGSLIRCTVERYDGGKQAWMGTGGGMLDRFVAQDFGKAVLSTCSARFLSRLPDRTRLIIMLGMGANGNYIRSCRHAIEAARPGKWRTVNDVAYADDAVTVVHTEHFASQGALLPNWLSGYRHDRGRFGLLARAAVATTLG